MPPSKRGGRNRDGRVRHGGRFGRSRRSCLPPGLLRRAPPLALEAAVNGWRRKREARERERESQVNFRCAGDEVEMLDQLKAAYDVSKGELLRMLLHREHAWLTTGVEIARPPRRRRSPVARLDTARRTDPDRRPDMPRRTVVEGEGAGLSNGARRVVDLGRGVACVEDEDDDPASGGTSSADQPNVEGTG